MCLQPLLALDQFVLTRLIRADDGTVDKPPFMATQPRRHASSTDPQTWAPYPTAAAAVEAGDGDAVGFVLRADNEFAVIDLDNCRDPDDGSIKPWAWSVLQHFRGAYVEISHGNAGLHIFGRARGPKPPRCRFDFLDGRVEIFRRTNKIITLTGKQLGSADPELPNIDESIEWLAGYVERRRQSATQPVNCAVTNGYSNGLSRYSVEQIETFVREGAPPDANRSDLFHAIVGHYLGCGWTEDQIVDHLSRFPDGIAERYMREERLPGEVARSISRYAPALPQPTQVRSGNGHDSEPAADEPQLHAHGDPDPRPSQSWLLKNLLPERGHGLLSGQWSTGKTFMALELAAAIGTGQPFCGHAIKRPSGVLLIAAEGAHEVRLRFEAVIREKCGGMERAPFRWYEVAPALLHRDGLPQLIAMARKAQSSIEAKHGLPLGLTIIDTVAACAGFITVNDDNSNAAGQAIMNVLKNLSQAAGCFVLGVDHFGKDMEAGTRGASAKESSADVVLACLGKKHLGGRVTDLRLAVRKARGGVPGREFPYALRIVEAPEPDEDGDPITTCVITWQPQRPPEAADPWTDARREDQRIAMGRLKRTLMSMLADHGVELQISPDGPVLRMVDQELVRQQFYATTPADGTPEQKGRLRRQRFLSALGAAEEKRLIGVQEIEGVTYLRLLDPREAEQPEA
jgi:hypothetical protein